MNTNAQSSTKSGGYICDTCETVRHCSQHGCVPLQPLPRRGLRVERADLQPVLTQLLHDGGESGIQQAVGLLVDYIDQGGGRA